MGTGHSLYENNSTGFSPYGSCNINTQRGCELDPQCTLFQQCVPLAAAKLEEQQVMIEKYGICPHMDVTSEQFKQSKIFIESWMNSPEGKAAVQKSAQEINTAFEIPPGLLGIGDSIHIAVDGAYNTEASLPELELK